MTVIRKTRRRHEIPGHARFLTFSCSGRRSFFNDSMIADLFAERLMWSRQRLGFELYAWVVMPEHVHLLVRPNLPEVTVSKLLMSLKRPSAKSALRHMADSGESVPERFWQAGGGYDRNVFSDDEMCEKMDYIHLNPVRRGLVERPEDWAWSSARCWLGLECRWGEMDRWV